MWYAFWILSVAFISGLILVFASQRERKSKRLSLASKGKESFKDLPSFKLLDAISERQKGQSKPSKTMKTVSKTPVARDIKKPDVSPSAAPKQDVKGAGGPKKSMSKKRGRPPAKKK